MKTLSKTEGDIFIKALCLYVFKCVPNSNVLMLFSFHVHHYCEAPLSFTTGPYIYAPS